MILGYNSLMGDVVDTPQIPVQNINYIEVSNCIVDEIQVRSTVVNQTDKESFTNDTIMLAKFLGDMEAGNIGMRENKIAKLRLKRREVGKVKFTTIKEFPFEDQILSKAYQFLDYEPKGNIEYEYFVIPVDESGIEGRGTAISALLNFEGWWLIDLDDPENYSLQFIFNMDSVNINTEQDRFELSTFAKFPYVKYGAKHCKRGSLNSLFADLSCSDSVPLIKLVSKLDEMAQKHKSYLLKDGNGHRYIVDIHSPVEQTYEAIKDISDISVEWYQVGEVND